MTTLNFVDTHNLVAFLSKPAECEGFEQIVDFLKANPIKYALTINPTTYVSCIEQFWSTAKAKTVNGEVQLHALVDGKKVLVTESSVRRDLHLEDAEGVDSLLNAIIFEELTRMGAKTTAWNEFSSTMAFAITCLATNQKFNFSKYIFDSMVKNLDNVGKFLMYPRFIQVFLDNQLEGMVTHDEIYIAPSHTKKIFGNMRRSGKGFSGRDTPLFPTMMVQAQEEIGEGSVNPIIIQPSSSQPQKKQQTRRSKKKDTQAPQPSGPTTNVEDETMGDTYAQTRFERVSKTSNDPLGEDSLKLNELMELCTNLQQRVLDLENTKTAQAQEITSLKLRVKKLEKKGRSKTHKLKRLYKIGSKARVASSDDEIDETTEDQGRFNDEMMFYVSDLAGEEVVVAEKGVPKAKDDVVSTTDVATTVSTAATTVTHEEITLAQALQELKTAKPKSKGIVFKEPVESTTITPTPIPSKIQDKGKGIMEEPEKPTKRKDQIRHDGEMALKLQAQMQAELEEEERLEREKEEEANIVSWDNVQAIDRKC
ncbi:hypothetical protein Tco_0047093 [Tanacetum coccineum]